MARDTKKVNLTLSKKTVEDLDRMAAAGRRSRTKQIELLVAREWGAVNPVEYPEFYQNVYPSPDAPKLGDLQLAHPPYRYGLPPDAILTGGPAPKGDPGPDVLAPITY